MSRFNALSALSALMAVALLAPAALANQLASDNFNRPNAVNLGANWTAVTAETTFQIAANIAEPLNDAGNHGNFYSAIAWPSDQYSEFSWTTNANLSTSGGPTVRVAAAAETYYLCNVTGPLGTTASLQIYSVSAGTFTSIAGPLTATVNAGDVTRCEAQGTTIRMKTNGVVQLSVVNTALAAGSAGIAGFPDGAVGGASRLQIDNWAGGDFVAAAAGCANPIALMGAGCK